MLRPLSGRVSGPDEPKSFILKHKAYKLVELFNQINQIELFNQINTASRAH